MRSPSATITHTLMEIHKYNTSLPIHIFNHMHAYHMALVQPHSNPNRYTRHPLARGILDWMEKTKASQTHSTTV